jgi:hypothetical protein
MIFAVTIAFVLLQAVPSSPTATGSAEIRFSFEHPQLDPSAYTLVIHEDGSGHYRSTPGTSAGRGIDGYGSLPTERDITVRDPLLATLFQTARSHHLFAMECEETDSKVAFTGKKTAAYTGSDGSGSCTYNYSHDKELNQLADDLMAVAFTLYEGNRLAIEHQHSRLALDSELENLQAAFKDHRALEIENIAPVLQSIADDEAVMNRARNRARSLLSTEAAKR